MNTLSIPQKLNSKAKRPKGKTSQEALRQELSDRGFEVLPNSEEVGAILRIHPKVAERMARRGDLPALKVGKFWRYRHSALDDWKESQSQSNRQPCRIETQF